MLPAQLAQTILLSEHKVTAYVPLAPVIREAVLPVQIVYAVLDDSPFLLLLAGASGHMPRWISATKVSFHCCLQFVLMLPAAGFLANL